MKFNILAEDLKSELANVGIARDKHSSAVAMGGVLIEVSEDGEIHFSAANAEYAITKTMDLNMGYLGGKCTFVAGSDVIDIVNKLSDGEVTINLISDTRIEIKQKKFKCEENVINSDNFIKKNVDGECLGTQKIDAETLKNMTKSVQHACAKEVYDTSQQVRKGIKLIAENGKIEAVCLDGVRIAICSAEHDGSDIDVILPGSTLKDMLKLVDGEVQISQYDNTYVISSNGYTIMVNRLSGELPNYKSILPTEFKGKLQADAQEIMKAADRLETVAKKNKKAIILEYSDGELKLSAESGNSTASETIECKELAQSEPLKMGINGKMLIDALKVLDGDTVIKYADKLKPLILSNSDDSNTQVIFPIRIREA